MANLFTSQTPTSTDNSDGTPGITVGTTVRFAQAGYVTGVRWYATATVGGTYIGALYQVTAADDPSPAGTLLASKTLGTTPTGGTWNAITFDIPVSVTTGVLYRAAVFSGDGRYVYAASLHASDIVNGDITADANGDDPVLLGSLRQATFAINASLTYPSNVAGSSGSYFADVEFSLTAGPITADAALAVTAALTTGATPTRTAAAALAATATLAAGAIRAAPATAALTATATLTAGATVTAAGTGAALAVTATLAAGATPARQAGAALAVTANLAAGPVAIRTTGAALAVIAALVADAASFPVGGSSAPGPRLRTAARQQLLVTVSTDRTLRTTTGG